MENYYKILEVDNEASQEIIEKSYKILVKKYHPDLQQDNKKSFSEAKIKKLNEAYDILSDKVKREHYNKQLNQHIVTDEKYKQVLEENLQLKTELNNIKKKLNNYNNIHNNSNFKNNVASNFQYNNTTNTQNNNRTNINNSGFSQGNINWQKIYANKGFKISNIKNLRKNPSLLNRLYRFIVSILIFSVALFLLNTLPYFKNFFVYLGNPNIIFILLLLIIIYLDLKR